MVFATPPLSPEDIIEQRLIEQRLVACGLDRRGLSVRYEDDLQCVEVTISPASGIHEGQFECIRAAATGAILTFTDVATSQAFQDFGVARYRRDALPRLTTEMAQRGLLDGFPDRTTYPDLAAYAEALELHLGLVPRSKLTVRGADLIIKPPQLRFAASDDPTDRIVCAAIEFASARGDAAFGFLGNECLDDPTGPDIADRQDR